MQRDRARERMERAKRQWELEHASDTCIDGNIIEKLILNFWVQNLKTLLIFLSTKSPL